MMFNTAHHGMDIHRVSYVPSHSRNDEPATDPDSELIIPTLPSMNQGTLAVGKQKHKIRKMLTDTIIEVILLIGNVMIQRGIWDGLDDKNVPAYVSGIIGLVLFAWTICLNNIFNTSNTAGRLIVSGVLLLCSINTWRCIWNIQTEQGVPVAVSTLVGLIAILIGTAMEHLTVASQQTTEHDASTAAELIMNIRNR
jgi:hypothetical protein